jgi:hypothetical protein
MSIARLSTVLLAAFLAGTALWAQARGGGAEWLTAHGDAQGTSWIRSDAVISPASFTKPGFDLQWKLSLDNQPRLANNLMQGVTANGVTLFVPMSLVAGSSNNIYAIDNEVGYTVWQRHFDLPLPDATAACPGGITAALTRIADITPPPLSIAVPFASTLRGRGRGYAGAIGQPGEGVPIDSPRRGGPARGARAGRAGRAGAAGANVAAARGGRQGGRGAAAAGDETAPGGIPGAPAGMPTQGYGRPAGVVYTITSDGVLHVLGLPSGMDIQKPAPFLPANANWSDPIAVNTTLYAATSGTCGGAPNGVWSVNLANMDKPVVSWQTHGGGIIGSPVFTTDGSAMLVTIGPGQAAADGYVNAVVALDPATLQPKGWFASDAVNLVSAPLVFRHEATDVAAVATSDGRIVLLDAHRPGGDDHHTVLSRSEPIPSETSSFAPGHLALWQQALAGGGTTAAGAGADAATSGVEPGSMWLLVPVSGGVANAGTWPTTHGKVTHGAIAALKITGEGGHPTLERDWVSADISSPATPLVVNGVVFAVPGGPEAGATSSASAPAVLYAMNGTNGAALWNSGQTMTAALSGRSFWSATGQVYVGTTDGVVYAFGYPMERD